ncbi:50S ribosomal protein L21 [Candidatus Sumerlaeota bacterium]|nr:50S ribosomal protein L21 [Candidatus Sumerlaeales bacterium]NLD62094.1 50S ribosomal protein L21 [Candidatus Sumerlaeota bacterium]
MYAILRTSGYQYRVEAGNIVRLPKMDAQEGANVEFDEVLQIGGENGTKIGTPVVDGAKVQATVVRHGKEAKIIVYKFKRRKGFEKTRGHRTQYTEVRINQILG